MHRTGAVIVYLLAIVSINAFADEWKVSGMYDGQESANQQKTFCLTPAEDDGFIPLRFFKNNVDQCRSLTIFYVDYASHSVEYTRADQFGLDLVAIETALTESKTYEWLDGYKNKWDQELAALQAALQAAQEKKARLDQLEQQKKDQLDYLAQSITFCAEQSALARAEMERQRQIAEESGYIDKRAMHSAGQIIVDCKNNTPRWHSEYRKLGGTKSLAQLQSPPR